MILAATIIFVLLATYWFGFKEGFFSGIVHLACVIVAGALALAFWEPLAHAMLGTGMREWAWGVSLLTLFSFSLFILRLAGNFLVPDKLNFPHLVDIIGGVGSGVASGLLTAGIGLIGIGMLPIGSLDGGGFVRMGDRSSQPSSKSSISFAVVATENFYDMLSMGAFSPMTNRGNLATSHPALSKQAWSLHRDTYMKGRIELAVAPEDLKIVTSPVEITRGEDELYVIPITIERSGFHKGIKFILSASQAHLIGNGKDPKIAFPSGWRKDGKPYKFDELSNYATNEDGAQQVSIELEFDKSDMGNQAPRHLMFKGLRIPLQTATTDASLLDQGGGVRVAYDPSAPEVPAIFVKVDNRLGVTLNRNSLPAGINAPGKAINEADGDNVPSRSNSSVSEKLRVTELYEGPNAKIVKLNVSRKKSDVDIWGDKRKEGGEDNFLELITEQGDSYKPIGWLWTKATDRMLNIKYDLADDIRVKDLPNLGSAGKDDLYILYRIPTGKTIVAVMIGETTICVTNVPVE